MKIYCRRCVRDRSGSGQNRHPVWIRTGVRNLATPFRGPPSQPISFFGFFFSSEVAATTRLDCKRQTQLCLFAGGGLFTPGRESTLRDHRSCRDVWDICGDVLAAWEPGQESQRGRHCVPPRVRGREKKKQLSKSSTRTVSLKARAAVAMATTSLVCYATDFNGRRRCPQRPAPLSQMLQC